MNQSQEKPAGFDSHAGEYAALIYDPIREKFAASNRFFFERKLQVIRRFFEKLGVETQKQRWLDVGCGQGDLLRLGRPYFQTAIGCDPSQGMLEACPDLDVRHQPSMDCLPFEDSSFDFITAVCVYHHVEVERRPFLTAEALRLLEPGGVFCVIEHNPLNPVTRLIVSRTPVDADAQLLGASQTRRILSSAGMHVLETRYFLLFPQRIHAHLGFLEDGLEGIPLAGQYGVFARAGAR